MTKGILSAILLIAALNLHAQFSEFRQVPAATDTPSRGFDPGRIVMGGNLSLTFGDLTFINISPQVGYRFSDFITAGGGINYINTGIKFRGVNGNTLYRENYGYAGINLFARVFPANFFFLMAQPETNYSWGKIRYTNGSPTQRLDGRWVPTMLIGAGIMTGGGGQRGMMLSVQYDIAQDPRSPYGTRPFIGMGFAF